MLRALTILLGSVTTAVLAFQVAMISAMDIHYWEVGEESTGWTIWCGVIAVGVMLGATILVMQMPKVASGVYLACLPLMVVYEVNQNHGGFISLEIPDSLGIWIGWMTVVLVFMAYFSGEEQEQPLN